MSIGLARTIPRPTFSMPMCEGNPALTVFAVGGDGDGLAIGGGHLPHIARRDVNVNYLLFDNSIYGLTKGQPSPSTPHGYKTKASPQGTTAPAVVIAVGALLTSEGEPMLERWVGFLFLVLLVAYLHTTYRWAKQSGDVLPPAGEGPPCRWCAR